MNKKTIAFCSALLLLTACADKEKEANEMTWSPETAFVEDGEHRVYYEIFVRAFADSNGDGIGDLQGATAKLDQLQELGVEGIWLMPIHPSPSYHGYDVTDYEAVHPDYGTVDDMKQFVEEAQERGIEVIIDFVMNHSSKEHPWFQKALTGDSTYRDYYVWSDESTPLEQVGDWGQKVWHGLGEEKYEGIFWDGMPDMNFENPEVMEEFKQASTFWLEEVGVDGFRVDAAKYLFSAYQIDDHHTRNVELWQEFKTHMESIKPGSFLVGEVWDSASVVGQYMGALDSGFNFDLSTKLISAIQSEQDTGIVSSLEKVRAYYQQTSPDFQDSIFLTNHDMDRIMSEVSGNIDHAKMGASLLLTLPGHPFLYYGEEIGLEGQKPDEHIREPMIWKAGEDEAETSWIERKYSLNKEELAVETQQADEDSLWNHYQEMISVRRSHKVLIDGEIAQSDIKKQGIISFERYVDDERVLVLNNVSGEEITVDVEEFGSLYYASETIKQEEGSLTLAPYSTAIYEK